MHGTGNPGGHGTRDTGHGTRDTGHGTRAGRKGNGPAGRLAGLSGQRMVGQSDVGRGRPRGGHHRQTSDAGDRAASTAAGGQRSSPRHQPLDIAPGRQAVGSIDRSPNTAPRRPRPGQKSASGSGISTRNPVEPSSTTAQQHRLRGSDAGAGRGAGRAMRVRTSTMRSCP